MNLQQWIGIGFLILVVIGIACIILGTVYRRRNYEPPLREVSKRRIGWMWIVDDDDSRVLTVVPKHPRRTEVQMYDEEQGKGGWLE